MKPVNLLPDELRPHRTTGALSGSSYVLVGVLAGLLVAAVGYVVTTNQINTHKTGIAKVEQETAEARAQVAELAPFQTFARIKAARLESVRQLADTRFDWERLMRELALVLPSGAYLNDLEATTSPVADGSVPTTGVAATGPSLTLKGCADDQPDVATLMVRLRELYRAEDVQLTESTEQSSSADTGAAAVVPGIATPGVADGGCPSSTYLFDVTVSFAAAPPEAPKGDRVPGRLGGGA